MGIFVTGWGVVSPAGWGAPTMLNRLQQSRPLPIQDLQRPGWEKPLRVLPVPTPESRPALLVHPRLRRSSALSQYALAAAVEALGSADTKTDRLGVVFCVVSGCVNYSRRFYDETLHD